MFLFLEQLPFQSFMKHTERKSHQSPRKCVQDFVDLTMGIGFQMPQFSAATRTLFLGGQNLFLGGSKVFGLVYISPSSLLISKKRKRSSCQFGLLLFEFSVDLRKKKVFSPNCSTHLSNKKRHHLETAASEREFGWACWAS